MVWREHSVYFYFTNTEGNSKKQKIEYPNIPSALLTVPHGLPIATPPLNCKDNNIIEMSDISDTSDENVGVGLSSLKYNLRVLFAVVNHLECDKEPGSREAKSSLPFPYFIAMEISSRYC
ncbi:hypothetical protein AVEN_205073-1 [Araneus ventricosus]|uniref:Uncharacterized protein n=1 Tax=Araneus ventricosus TaxID=182803 RepID=A0A4Y2H1B4_ARAVE|nr:hypothetical protein AVEN_205073-1 [Araneus ventricosus]